MPSRVRQAQGQRGQTDTPERLSSLDNVALLRLRALVEVEMRKRGIALTVGEVGERLVVDHFKGTPGLPTLLHAPRGTKNVDALSRSGERYSIKTVCTAKKTGTIYPDSGDANKQLFEYLLIARLSKSWDLLSIHQLSWDEFRKVRSWDRRMNAWYVSASARALAAATLVLEAGPSPSPD